jgi:hypothetical protein
VARVLKLEQEDYLLDEPRGWINEIQIDYRETRCPDD